MTPSQKVQELWLNEVYQLKSRGKSLKLIILGEAPLSPSQYFYVKNGNYLSALKKIYMRKCGLEIFPVLNYHLYMDGILLMELYKDPLPSSNYDKDINFSYWDAEYFCSQLAILKSAGLLNEDTKIVFRYKKSCQNYSAPRGKNVESFINSELLPLFKRYGLFPSNFITEVVGSKSRFATLSNGNYGNGLNECSEVYNYLYSIAGCWHNFVLAP